MLRTILAVAAGVALGGEAFAQASEPAQGQPQQYQPPPPQYQPPPPQAAPPPQQPAAPQQPAPSQPAQPSAQGTGQQYQQPPPPPPPPAAPGGGSQQVVVNPPSGAQGSVPPPPPPTVNVNPPAVGTYGQAYPPPTVERQGESRSSLEVVAIDAAYGALAGLLVGAGVALIANNDDWGRDLMIGTGAGILVGAAVGGIHAYNASAETPRRYALDGLGSPARTPPLAGAHAMVGYAGRF
ncbi:MAG: hypothetical protein ACJ79R_03535 [Anaeromyxobacteraceae bacterium]